VTVQIPMLQLLVLLSEAELPLEVHSVEASQAPAQTLSLLTGLLDLPDSR
jgi:hypothetical protein